jgi:hypothetical protein
VRDGVEWAAVVDRDRRSQPWVSPPAAANGHDKAALGFCSAGIIGPKKHLNLHAHAHLYIYIYPDLDLEHGHPRTWPSAKTEDM